MEPFQGSPCDHKSLSMRWSGIWGRNALLAATWSILGAEDDETVSKAFRWDLRYRHHLCMDVLIGRRLEANLNKNALHNYERLNQVRLNETTGKKYPAGVWTGLTKTLSTKPPCHWASNQGQLLSNRLAWSSYKWPFLLHTQTCWVILQRTK